MKVTVTAGLDRGLVLQLASYFSTFVPYINSYTYRLVDMTVICEVKD